MKTSTGYSHFGIPNMTPKTQEPNRTSRKYQPSRDNSPASDTGLPRVLLYFSEVEIGNQTLKGK